MHAATSTIHFSTFFITPEKNTIILEPSVLSLYLPESQVNGATLLQLFFFVSTFSLKFLLPGILFQINYLHASLSQALSQANPGEDSFV